MYDVYNTSKCIRDLRENHESWKTLLAKIKDIHDKQWVPSSSNHRYNNLVYDDISKISFQDINKIKKWCKKNIATGIDKGKISTVISVYKDTLYKDNLGKIWPKPKLLDFGPSLYKDNLGKIIKRVYFQN